MNNSLGNYEYINAKLKARIGNIRESKLEDELMKAGGVVEAVGALREHGFEEAAVAYDKTGDLQMVELSLLKQMVQDYKSIQSQIAAIPKSIVEVTLAKIELDNVKSALRLWYSSAVHHRAITYRTSYLLNEKLVNNIHLMGIVNALSFDQIIEAVANTWYEPIMREYSFSQIEDNGLFDLESSLDRGWYQLMDQANGRLKGEDKTVATQMFKTEVDLKNLLMLIRYGWFHQMDGEKLKGLLYPYGSVYRNSKVRDYLNEDKKKRNAEALLYTWYPKLSQTVKEKGVVNDKLVPMIEQTRMVEHFLVEKRRGLALKGLSGNPFTIGIALAYFYFKEAQYNMICGLLGAKYYGIDSAENKGMF